MGNEYAIGMLKDLAKTLSNLPQGSWIKRYNENCDDKIFELNQAIKTLQDSEVIAEGVVRLECPTVGIGNSNIPSLNWFEIIKDYVGKQVKLILIKKGE